MVGAWPERRWVELDVGAPAATPTPEARMTAGLEVEATADISKSEFDEVTG